MVAEMEFTIGARAICSDGSPAAWSSACSSARPLRRSPTWSSSTGTGRRPAARTHPPGRDDDGEIRLHCPLAEFDKFDHAEEREVLDASDQHVGDVTPRPGVGIQPQRRVIARVGGPGELIDIGPMPRQDTARRR